MVMGMKKVQKKFVKVYHAEPPNYPEIVNGKYFTTGYEE